MSNKVNYSIGLSLIEKGSSLMDCSLTLSGEGEKITNILNTNTIVNSAYSDIYSLSFEEEVFSIEDLLDEYLKANDLSEPALPPEINRKIKSMKESNDPYVRFIYGMNIYLLGLNLLKVFKFNKDEFNNLQIDEECSLYRIDIENYYSLFKKFKNCFRKKIKELLKEDEYKKVLELADLKKYTQKQLIQVFSLYDGEITYSKKQLEEMIQVRLSSYNIEFVKFKKFKKLDKGYIIESIFVSINGFTTDEGDITVQDLKNQIRIALQECNIICGGFLLDM